MEIGRLNQRIDIIKNVTETDEIGNHSSQWEKIFSCWASVYVKNSTETTETGVTREVQSTEITVRQNPQTETISATAHCVKFRGEIYNINGILPNFRSQDYMKISVSKRKAGE